MIRLKLTPEQKKVLIELYERADRTVDDLPYTENFETLYTGFIARTGLILTRHDVWRASAASARPNAWSEKNDEQSTWPQQQCSVPHYRRLAV